jgi:tRNA pseudouridine38-40 synthase
MPRYKLTIEYDGTPFVGWQAQAQGLSVQGTIADAVTKFSGDVVEVRGAGRTDAGVHACGQVAHIDLERAHAVDSIRGALNFHVRPMPIAILSVEAVAETFDARFSAVARHYLYRVLNRRAPPVLDRDRVWWTSRSLDAERMADAAGVLVGRHDFTTFRSVACQARSPVKTLDRLAVVRHGDEIHIAASAQSFMHNQVRSIVGSLKLVGEGRWSKNDLASALEARERSRCGPVAPACGLYLTRVDYPGDLVRGRSQRLDGDAAAPDKGSP